MNVWKFYDITHREHIICNPTSTQKLDELIALLRLAPEARVLDIATGKAEFLIRLAEKYGVEGVGVDLSPYCVSDAKEKHRRRVPDADLVELLIDIPTGEHPFDEIHEQLEFRGIDVGREWVRARVNEWIGDGTIIAFGVAPAQ